MALNVGVILKEGYHVVTLSNTGEGGWIPQPENT
jgi:hypothetical protein